MNSSERVPAASLGPTIIPWWLDWRGRCAAIVASGPSTKKEDVALLRGRIATIAIKENHDLAPWADVVYGCDAAWWRNNNGLDKYHGLKVAADRRITHQDIHLLKIEASDDIMRFDTPGQVGSGGNSGFQALNLAVQFGAQKILLIGFDVSDRSGVHWYGRNHGMGRSNPSEINFRRWRAAFYNAAGPLENHGIEVINASENSTLKCFRRGTVAGALEAWGI